MIFSSYSWSYSHSLLVSSSLLAAYPPSHSLPCTFNYTTTTKYLHIFDLEIVLLLPLVMTCSSLWMIFNPLAFGFVLFFMSLLTLAFLYEWFTGALNFQFDGGRIRTYIGVIH